jgi:short-subunit dehydrogenase
MMHEGFIPDCAILAAGVFENDLLPHYNRTLVDKNFSVNFFGALNVVDALLPVFLERGEGHVIALSSIAAFRPNARGVGYPASKAALSLAMRGFDMAYRLQGVAFSVAYIGPVKTRMWDGGNSFLAVSPKHIAGCISWLVHSRKSVAYMPFFSTALARLLLLIPDWLYVRLRKMFLG